MDKKDIIRQRLKERTASKRYKLAEGENTFRVLPNKLGEEHLDFYEYGMHSNVGPNNRYLRCGRKRSGKGDCWICTKIEELAESKKSSHRAAAEKMARVEKFATQISPINDGTWLPPTLFEMPGGVANGLLGIMHRKAVTDLKKGYNLTIERAGTTFKGTKYGSLLVDDEPSKVPSKIVEAMKTFDELVPKYSEPKQKEAYYGHEQEEDDDDVEEVKKPKRASEDDDDEEETPKKKKPVDDDDEEADAEDSEFDELADEEDETPKKKKKVADDDDDEEDEPAEDEEDEDEAPKKKKKKAVEDDDEEDADDDEPVKKKKKPADDDDEPEEDEDEAPPKKKKKVVEDEEEDEDEDSAPKKKKKKAAVPDDDDDE